MREAEHSETKVSFGSIAHRFSGYDKSGISVATPFKAKGVINTQFVHMSSGWKMSVMVCEDGPWPVAGAVECQLTGIIHSADSSGLRVWRSRCKVITPRLKW